MYQAFSCNTCNLKLEFFNKQEIAWIQKFYSVLKVHDIRVRYVEKKILRNVKDHIATNQMTKVDTKRNGGEKKNYKYLI